MLNEGLETFRERLPYCNKFYFLLSSKSKIRLKDTHVAMISTYILFSLLKTIFYSNVNKNRCDKLRLYFYS